jgi:hypothetical protein
MFPLHRPMDLNKHLSETVYFDNVKFPQMGNISFDSAQDDIEQNTRHTEQPVLSLSKGSRSAPQPNLTLSSYNLPDRTIENSSHNPIKPAAT